MGRFQETTEEKSIGRFQSSLATPQKAAGVQPRPENVGLFSTTGPFRGARALITGEQDRTDLLKSAVKEVPEQAKKIGGSIVNTFFPAVTNFFKTTGGIIGEGLAYAIDPVVREEYEAGNLDILPTITDTTQADVAKFTIAAGIETAVYRVMPAAAKLSLVRRGGVGALQGLGFAVAEGLAHEKSAEEIIDQAMIYGVGGAALEIISPYLLPLLKAELRNLPKEARNMFKGVEEEAVKKLPVTPDSAGPTKVPIRTPNTEYQAYLRSQGYEPYIPSSELPVIQVGRAGKSDLPSVKIEEPGGLPAPAGTKLVPDEPKFPRLERKPQSVESVAPINRITSVSRDQLPVGSGVERISRLEARVKGLLDDTNIGKIDDAGIVTFNAMNKKEQMRAAAQFVLESPDDALRVVKGEIPPPKGLLNNSIALAFEKSAEQAADAPLAIRLASLRSTRAGQEISILTEADPMNPITQINEVIKARTAASQRRLSRGNTVKAETDRIGKEAGEHMKKEILKIDEAERILQDILC